jgi:hypothetical protein
VSLRQKAASFTFRQVVWMVPVFLTIHNLEVVFTAPRWTERNIGIVGKVSEGFPPVATGQHLYLTFLLATLLPFVIPWLAMYARKNGPLMGVVLALQMLVLVNAFVPHLASAVVLRAYTPGVVTAALLNIPLSLYLFWLARKEELISQRRLVFALIGGLLAYLPVLALGHIASALLLRLGGA